MKNKILAILLSVWMLLSVLPTAAAAEAPDEAPDEAPVETALEPEQPAPDIPVITAASASKNGVTLRWTPYAGTAKYFVFTQKPAGGWKKLGESASTSFEHRITPNGTPYLYTVRAADKNGKFISGFDKTGFAFTCLPVPTFCCVENLAAGQRFSWNPVPGAAGYRVYLKGANGWQAIADVTDTSYLNTDVRSGARYTYTVRCRNPETRALQSYFNTKGISATYIAAPRISGFSPVSGGISVRWEKPDGAVRCAVFIKTPSKWKKLGVTDKTSFTQKELSDGSLCTYTVRCVGDDGRFISAAAPSQSFRYVAPPQNISMTNRTLRWDASPYASSCCIYRKPFNGSWAVLAKTAKKTYTDTSAARNSLYTYTVRCLDENGSLISHFINTGIWYYNGNPAEGKIKVGSDSLNFSGGRLRQGYVTIDGKTYYYNANGVLQKNGLVGSSKEGWRYADSNGVVDLKYTGLASNSAGTWYVKNGKLDRTLRDAITIGGTDYLILNGRAHPVSTEEERTLYRAMKLANRVASRSLPKERRLKLLWDYIRDAYEEMNPRLPDYTGMDWPIIYANDMLIYKQGNCLSYGAEFCFLAKAIGYNDVYACHSGGHGWSEIDGLVYDPEWSRHSFDYSYYALSYDAHTDQDYRGAISPGYAWMHVKICPHL